MTVVSVSNTRNPRQAPPPPRKPNGAAYRYELITHDGDVRYYADDVIDLMPGVMNQDAERITLDDRIQHARFVQAITQNFVLRQAILDGVEVTDHMRAVTSGDEPVGDAWEETVPLVLVSVDFAPHTDVPRPFSIDGDVQEPSNIIWLYPETNESYLYSLADAGWVRLSRHVTHTP